MSDKVEMHTLWGGQEVMGSGSGSIPILPLTPICLVANLPIENYNHNHFSIF